MAFEGKLWDPSCNGIFDGLQVCMDVLYMHVLKNVLGAVIER